jgi:hypothetical protein
MSTYTVVVKGVVKPNGTLELEGKPELPVGPVEVVVRALPEAPAPPTTEEGWWPCMQRIRAEREAAGYRFMNETEMLAHISWLRDDQDRMDGIYRELEQQRRQRSQS